MCVLDFQSFTGSALAALVKGLPEALQRQYEYEDPIVRGGKQLLHSPFFKVRSQPGALELSSSYSNHVPRRYTPSLGLFS